MKEKEEMMKKRWKP
uniref:Uncharacterized protein n=1 Tax=Vitis vinifera TaxID=29760 RepID=F6I5N5_VITVI